MRSPIAILLLGDTGAVARAGRGLSITMVLKLPAWELGVVRICRALAGAQIPLDVFPQPRWSRFLNLTGNRPGAPISAQLFSHNTR
jgi:hypothetical protein